LGTRGSVENLFIVLDDSFFPPNFIQSPLTKEGSTNNLQLLTKLHTSLLTIANCELVKSYNCWKRLFQQSWNKIISSQNLRRFYKVCSLNKIMKKKQVIISILLIIAIVLSSVSVIMNVSVMKDIKSSSSEVKESTAEISITILPNNQKRVLENEAG